MRALLALLLLLPACAPSLDDDDATGDDDDATGDDDDDATGDDDDATGDDDDATGDDDDATGDDDDATGDDDDDVVGACDEVLETLEPDEDSALGFSGADVVAPIAGPASTPATWSGSGDATTVGFTLSLAGDPVFHDLTQPAEPPPWGPEPACADWLEVPVAITFTTADGGFNEQIVASLYQQQEGGPSFSAFLPWEALGGTYTITEIVPAEWDTVSIDIWAAWDGAVATGQVSMNASRTNPNGVGEGMVGPVVLW